MSFTPCRLTDALSRWPAPGKYWAAFSGGLDSTVLLHALASLRAGLPAPLAAVHLHHGLQPLADDWAVRCATFCRELGISYVQRELALCPPKGVSLEAFAREARYGALAGLVEEGEMLITAHHQDDQAETVLLQLLRGSGVGGLAAMPELVPFGRGWHGRPLLGFGRAELLEYAQREGLTWVEDPTNADSAFDRNFVRGEVLPVLKRRWPGLGRTVSRTARLCAEAQGLIDDQAWTDLAELTGPVAGAEQTPWERRAAATAVPPSTLGAARLAELSAPRARAALRLWIREAGMPLPDSNRLEELLHETTTAGADRNPVVQWAGVEARRFRGRIHLLPTLPPIASDLDLVWGEEGELRLPQGLGRLSVEEGEGGDGRLGMDPAIWRTASRRVRFRSPGERCRPAGRGHHRSLKHLLQELGVPLWWRDRLPLIYLDGRLAAVGDLLVCHPFGCPDGLKLVWERAASR